MLGYGSFITPQGLINLKNYKYRSGLYTYGDNLMQPFWNWFVTLIPLVGPVLTNAVGCTKSYNSNSAPF